jgi:TetR/AcrR family transcriptional regulator, repressor for uid operon
VRKVDPAKHEEKRHEILKAAAQCFERNGFQGASISHICAGAGMSAGHLYHYFPSKESIVEAMIDANLERAANIFGETAKGESVLDALVAHLERSAPDDGRSTPLLFDMFAEAGRNPTMAKVLGEHSDRMQALLVDLLRRGQERGEVDPSLDPEVVAPVLISLVDGSKTLSLRNPHLTPRGCGEVFRTLISRFLSPPASK